MSIATINDDFQIVTADPIAVNMTRYPDMEPKAFLEKALRGPIESCSDYTGRVLKWRDSQNSLAVASNIAYDQHYPLRLSPDIIWLTLTQGLANHINKNAEALRKHFVAHEGKALIHIQRDDFIRLSPENPWEEVFPEFALKIKEHIGEKNYNAIVADFSTTDAKAKAASEITLMDAMQAYFEYGMSTCCGIPYFEITGTVDDWEYMKERVGEWAKWGLEWWVPHVQHVIANLVLAVRGEADKTWFRHYFKETDRGSGGPYISGWMTWLFPYYKDYRDNLHENRCVGKLHDGHFKTTSFPVSTAKAPFWWNYYGSVYDYQFVGGLTGIEQRDDFTIVPRVGWVVMQDPKADKEQQGRPFDDTKIAPVIEPPKDKP